MDPLRWMPFSWISCLKIDELKTVIDLNQLEPNNGIYIYAFSRRFYPKRLTVHSGYTFFFFLLVCVFPGNQTHNPFALLTQYSTTEPQEHYWAALQHYLNCLHSWVSVLILLCSCLWLWSCFAFSVWSTILTCFTGCHQNESSNRW